MKNWSALTRRDAMRDRLLGSVALAIIAGAGRRRRLGAHRFYVGRSATSAILPAARSGPQGGREGTRRQGRPPTSGALPEGPSPTPSAIDASPATATRSSSPPQPALDDHQGRQRYPRWGFKPTPPATGALRTSHSPPAAGPLRHQSDRRQDDGRAYPDIVPLRSGKWSPASTPFMLGAQSVNPERQGQDRVGQPGTIRKEADAAKVLIGQGADYPDLIPTPLPLQVAQEKGISAWPVLGHGCSRPRPRSRYHRRLTATTIRSAGPRRHLEVDRHLRDAEWPRHGRPAADRERPRRRQGDGREDHMAGIKDGSDQALRRQDHQAGRESWSRTSTTAPSCR